MINSLNEKDKHNSSKLLIKKTTDDHFVIEGDKIYAGKHLILDMWGIEFDNKINSLEHILIKAAEEAKATVLHAHFHHFGNEQGISGVLVLAESHISIHTWPERNYIALDIFMCGATFPELAVNLISKELKPKNSKLKTIYRGEV